MLYQLDTQAAYRVTIYDGEEVVYLHYYNTLSWLKTKLDGLMSHASSGAHAVVTLLDKAEPVCELWKTMPPCQATQIGASYR